MSEEKLTRDERTDTTVAVISVKYDDRDTRKPGWKFAEYELKGVPVRLALGPRDLENGTVEVARRDTLQKSVVALDGVDEHIEKLLEEIQSNIFNVKKILAIKHKPKYIIISYDFNSILMI